MNSKNFVIAVVAVLAVVAVVYFIAFNVGEGNLGQGAEIIDSTYLPVDTLVNPTDTVNTPQDSLVIE